MSNVKHKDTDYLFLSTMLRAREPRMLTREKAMRMLDASGFEEAAKQLVDCDYPDMSAMTAGEIEDTLAQRRASVFWELAQLSPEPKLIDVFRMKYDYHNAKTLIKAEGAGTDGEHLLSHAGRIPPEQLAEAYHNENFISIPARLAAGMTEAKSILARSANPQLADFALDKAYFAELLETAESLESPFLTGYAQTQIDSANLRAAVRTLRMGRDTDFLRQALIPGGTVGTERILGAASSGEGLAALFASSPVADAAALSAGAASGGTLTAFELACDNAVTNYLRRAKLKGFGEEPVIAYMAALEAEITAARMILTGRLSGIAPAVIRERLRETYA